MAFDWADSLSEFYIAYPGRDPLDCTIAVFEALCKRASRNKSWLEGRWTDQDNLSEKVGFDNRIILLQWTLPSYFRNPFEETEDEY